MNKTGLGQTQLRAILESQSEGIIYQRSDGKILLFNKSAQQIFGLSEDAAYGRTSTNHDWHLVYSDGTPCPGEDHPSMKTLRTGQALSDQIRGISKPGRPTIWLSINTSPILRLGKELPEAVVISLRDITQFKRAEDELKESQARYREIFETNQAPKLLIDPADGSIVDANQAACEFYGYTLAQIREKNIAEINTLSPEAVKKEMESAERKDRLVFQFRHRLKSGELRDVEVYSGPVMEQGRVLLHSIIIDVTESKRAEEALKASEEKHRQLVKHAPAGIYEINLTEMRFLSVNEVMCHYTGYSRAEFLELNPMNLLSEDSHLLFMERMQKIAKGEEVPSSAEFQIQTKEGNFIWALVNSKIRRLESGELRASVVAYDVSDRKRVEEALKKSEANYKFLTENTPDIIWTTDLNFQTTYTSPSVKKVLGYSPDESKRLPFEETLTPESLQRCLDALAQEIQRDKAGAAPDRSVNLELEYYHKNGSTVWLEVSVKAIRNADGEMVGLHGVSRDITKRKRVEEDLRLSNQRLAEAQRIGGMGDWDWYPATNTVYWSENLYNIFGLDPSQPPPEYEGQLALYHPDDAEKLNEAVQRCQEEGKPYELEMRRIDPGGRIVHVLVRGVAEKDQTGKIKRLYGTVQDITESKLAEEALHSSEAHLEEAQRIAHVGSWDWVAATDEVTWSKELYRIFEVDPNKPAPNLAEQERLYTPESMELLRTAVSRIMQVGVPYEVELECVQKDGLHRWLLSRGERWYDEQEGLIGLRGTALDITERKRAEESLRQSKALLDATGRMARVGGWELDAETLKVTWTEETHRIHEVPLDYKPPLEEAINFWHPDDRDTADPSNPTGPGKGRALRPGAEVHHRQGPAPVGQDRLPA
jgi:PAS domain S-box-containing protein